MKSLEKLRATAVDAAEQPFPLLRHQQRLPGRVSNDAPTRPRYRIWNHCGSGLQYNVYDLRDGRVLKIPRSYPAQFWRLVRRRRPRGRAAFAAVAAEARRQELRIGKALDGLRTLLPRIDRTLVGDPEFFAGGCYTQEKAAPLGTIFWRADAAEQRRLIDLYIASVLDSWRSGLCDEGFHFLHNAGLASGGRMIVLDLAGVSTKRTRALRLVERQDWLTTRSYLALVRWRIETARYFVAAAEQAFTPEAVKAVWRASLRD
jgi:hypothetical protein